MKSLKGKELKLVCAVEMKGKPVEKLKEGADVLRPVSQEGVFCCNHLTRLEGSKRQPAKTEDGRLQKS